MDASVDAKVDLLGLDLEDLERRVHRL
jgi:hypothetical protein